MGRSEAKGIDGKEANGNGTNATMVAAKREIDDFCTGAHRVARATDAGGFFHVRNDSISSPPGGSAATSPTSVLDDAEERGGGNSERVWLQLQPWRLVTMLIC